MSTAAHKIPGSLHKQQFRAYAWTLWILPLIQCLVAGMATPKAVSLSNTLSGLLFWICAILPLWWLSHLISRTLINRLEATGIRFWIVLALASFLAFMATAMLGYFFLLDQIFSQWMGGFEPPFAISTPRASNLYSASVIFGATGHALIWLCANLSARFLLGTTMYDERPLATHRVGTVPTFFHRVPEKLGSDLLAIRAQEHYIDVHTSAGSTLILYRFGDALNELAEVPGMQVHRSFWVADGSVSSYKRSSGQLVLTLKDGFEVPVSRSFLRDVEQSGLLPEPK